MAIAPAAYERLAEKLLEAYEQAELTMTEKVARRLMRGVTESGWAERKLAEVADARREIRKVVDDMRRNRRAAEKDIIGGAHKAGVDAFALEAERFAGFSGITAISPSAQKVANILAELDTALNAADRVILRRANDVYTDVIADASARLASGTITSREAVQGALNSFANRGVTSFVDKAGHAWEMFSYAEMATITAIGNATLTGYTDTMQSFGYDLAIISSHWGACPLCAAWENVVVSVSGKDRNYPSLAEARDAGAFHPRCLHHLSVYHPDLMPEARSTPRAVEKPDIRYTTRQQQRACERQVRTWKRRMAAAITPEEERYAYAKVRAYQSRIRQIVGTAEAQTGEWLPRKYWREGGRALRLSPAAAKLKPIRIQ